MNLPNLGVKKPLGTNDYMVQHDPAAEKKKKILYGAGIGAVLIALLLVLTSSKPQPGQPQMQAALQSTADALGITLDYTSKLTYAPTEDDVALTQTLLRGNYQALNTMYNKAFKPNKMFPPTPKSDKASVAKLDESVRNNTIDNDISTVLLPKIVSAEQNLEKAKPLFTNKDSVQKIQTGIDAMKSIEKTLNQPV